MHSITFCQCRNEEKDEKCLKTKMSCDINTELLLSATGMTLVLDMSCLYWFLKMKKKILNAHLKLSILPLMLTFCDIWLSNHPVYMVCVTLCLSFSPATSDQLTVSLVFVFEHSWQLTVYARRQVQFRLSHPLVQAKIRPSLIRGWWQSLPYSKHSIDSISKHAIKVTSAIWAKCQPQWGPVHVNMRAFSTTL